MYVERRLDELERRVARLEYREGCVIAVAHKEPGWQLHAFALENDLDGEQMQGVCDAMEACHKAIEKGEPMDAGQFEEWLRPHIPAKEKPGGQCSPFIKCLLIRFTLTGQWSDVCDHFRRDFNVPPRDRLAGD